PPRMWRQTPQTNGPCRATSSANASWSSRIRANNSASDRESPTARRTSECSRCSITGLFVGFMAIVAANWLVLRRIVEAFGEWLGPSGPGLVLDYPLAFHSRRARMLRFPRVGAHRAID